MRSPRPTCGPDTLLPISETNPAPARPMTTALLIIDVQQGLCEGEGRAFESDEVIARINGVATQVRGAGWPVVFIQHESSAGYLEHGSREWQLADGLQAAADDLRVRKTTPDAFQGTDLDALLKAYESVYGVSITRIRHEGAARPLSLLMPATAYEGQSRAFAVNGRSERCP